MGCRDLSQLQLKEEAYCCPRQRDKGTHPHLLEKEEEKEEAD
jgi:hypothetical protein